MEQLVGDLLARQDGQTAAEVIEIPAVLGQGDQLLGERLDFLGFGQGRLDLAVFDQARWPGCAGASGDATVTV